MNFWTIPLRICLTAIWMNIEKVVWTASEKWMPENFQITMQVNNLAALTFGCLAIWCWGRK